VKIQIQTIPHKDHRYQTVGDWQWDKKGTLQIKVSDTKNDRMNSLLALHELLEALSCRFNGVSETVVDDFDLTFEGWKDNEGEPGDHPLCPYHYEHFFATNLERITAQFWNVNWSEYEEKLKSILKGE
jgi:hypothetical protein